MHLANYIPQDNNNNSDVLMYQIKCVVFVRKMVPVIICWNSSILLFSYESYQQIDELGRQIVHGFYQIYRIVFSNSL